MPRPAALSRSSLALDNLRAVVILIVLAFHSVLAYVEWTPATSAGFDDPPYAWRAFPIVDSHRWFGFDLFCAWQDVYLMSLLFLLSGLFVWPSLLRKRNWGFLRDRLLRLGLPFVFGVVFLVPLAIYPAYRVRALDPSVSAYWQHYLSLPFLPNGQLWFLWQLLALNVVVTGLNWIAPNALKALGRWSAAAGKRPARYFAILVAVSALAYVPMALAFTPWEWSNSGPLAVQFCRPLLYAVYFFAGVGIGVEGIDHSLLAVDGPLPQRWAWWLAAALGCLFLWMGLTALTMNGPAPIAIDIAADFSFVLACASGSLFLIAASLRFVAKRSPDSRQPLGQCLQPLSRALRLRGLAAIRAAWRRAVCGHQGCDRVRRDADPELDHDRCGAAHSVRSAAHRRHAACDRSHASGPAAFRRPFCAAAAICFAVGAFIPAPAARPCR